MKRKLMLLLLSCLLVLLPGLVNCDSVNDFAQALDKIAKRAQTLENAKRYMINNLKKHIEQFADTNFFDNINKEYQQKHGLDVEDVVYSMQDDLQLEHVFSLTVLKSLIFELASLELFNALD